jgi:hypothetical protein
LRIARSNSGEAVQPASQARSSGQGWSSNQAASTIANCRTKGMTAASASACPRAEELLPGATGEPSFQLQQELRAQLARVGGCVHEPARVFVAVELRLEAVVARGHEREHVVERCPQSASSQRSGSLRRSAHSMMSRLCSSTAPSGSTSTGTVPLGEAASISAGLSFRTTSRSSQCSPLAANARRARMA